jgi:hypothetical protein
MAGIGGRDIRVKDFERMFDRTVKGEIPPEKYVFMVRGES